MIKTGATKKVYDTQTATIVYKYTYGTFGEATGYEKTLYVTPEGNYFFYMNGGADSEYPVEKIRGLSEVHAKAWLRKQN